MDWYLIKNVYSLPRVSNRDKIDKNIKNIYVLFQDCDKHKTLKTKINEIWQIKV